MTLAAIAACAMFLAACGGGDDDSSSSSSVGDSTAVAPGTSDTGDEAAGAGETSGEEDEATTPTSSEEGESSSENPSPGGSDGSSAKKDGSSKRKYSDLPDRGEVSSQSAAFQQYSRPGKLHLAEFGEEAASTDFNEVNEVVVGYLEAAGAEEWEKACTYLLPIVKGQVQQLAKAAKEPVGDSCGAALGLFAKTPLWKADDGTPIYASEGISSLRMKEGGLARGGAGFALFHGSDGEDHWMALKFEGGGWGLLSTSPQPFL